MDSTGITVVVLFCTRSSSSTSVFVFGYQELFAYQYSKWDLTNHLYRIAKQSPPLLCIFMLMRVLRCSACRLLTFIKVWFHFTLSDSQQPKVRFYCAILYTPYTFLSSWDQKFSGGNGDVCNRWHRQTTRSYIALVYRTASSERLACGRDLSKSVHINDSAT